MNIDRLKLLRLERNISQKELAKIIGLDNTLLNKYENNYNTIPLTHLNTICNYFNVSLDYIFNFTNIRNYKNSIDELDKSKVGQRLKMIRKDNKLTQEKLAQVLNTTHSVISDYERGRFLISTSFLYAICKNYGVSADYLLGKIDEEKIEIYN